MSNLNGCLVTVEGNYFALAGRVDRKKVKKPYIVQVRVASPEGALSVIKNKLLDKILAKKYDDYHTYHTHEITEITDLEGRALIGYTNVRIMNFNQIADYVRANNLPLKLELYTELDTLRTMVFLAETNEPEFHRKQISLEKEAREDAVLAKLNPDLFDSHKPIAIPTVQEVPKIEPDRKIQNVNNVWDSKKRKYVPADEFVEDFNRPEEAPYGKNIDDEINQNPPAQVGESTGAVTVAKPIEQATATKNLIDEL